MRFFSQQTGTLGGVSASLAAFMAIVPSLAAASLSPSNAGHAPDSMRMHARAASASFSSAYMATNYQNGSTAPGASASDNKGQTVVVGGTGADDDSQRPGCPTIFINSAAVSGSFTAGWQEVPNVLGFYTDRNLTYSGSTMPVFIEANKDFKQVKRVVITQPGKPRDSWKYANLFRNSLICAVSNSSMDVNLSDVLVVAPVWLDKDDHAADTAAANDVYFSDGGWNVGSKAQGPGQTDVSSFQVLDDLITRFANMTEFPALNSIKVVGHSLGGSTAQRYAFLRNKDKDTDDLVSFWIGNPGAYVWPSPDRPVTPSNTSCKAEKDEWAYGVSAGLPAYVKGKPTPDTLYERYRARTIQYALGLKDNGPGDTHCEAQYQGDSHLERGQNMQKALQAMQGGMPASQSFNYVPNTSHQDYLMMSDPNSQEYLFVDGLSAARPQSSISTQGGSSGSASSASTKRGGAQSAGTQTYASSPSTLLWTLSCSLAALYLGRSFA